MAIELISLIQAVDYLKCSEMLSEKSKKIYADLRNIVPVFVEDSTKYNEVRKMKEYIIEHDLKIV
jgi:histidine ammonia-lyase